MSGSRDDRSGTARRAAAVRRIRRDGRPRRAAGARIAAGRGGRRDAVSPEHRGSRRRWRRWWRRCGRRRPAARRCWCRSIRRAGWCSGCARPRPSGRRCCRWAAAAIRRARRPSGGRWARSWRRWASAGTSRPVLDVHTNPANPVIGNRAFGDDARRGQHARAGVLARAARRRAGRLRQALPRARRHAHRFAPRAAGRRARRRSAARRRAGAVRGGGRARAWRRS